MICDKCEMLMIVPMKAKSKNPEDLIKHMKMGEKIHCDNDLFGEYEYYVWADGYKCQYNAEESLHKKDLPEKGNCRLRK